MEQLFYLLIPLGLCLFYLGIKYTIRFGRAKMLYEMPYVIKKAPLRQSEQVLMAYGLVEKCLQRRLLASLVLTQLMKKTGRTIPLFLSIMRARVNGITHSRMELYTFDAGPGTYRLSVTEDPFVLDAVMKKSRR